MEPTKLSFYEELEHDIKNAYEKVITPDEAERLAAKFLLAQLDAGRELSNLDLNARMKKTSLKACKGEAHLQYSKVNGEAKKPPEAALASMVDCNSVVLEEQDRFDRAEIQKNLIQNYLEVFRESHIYFRALAKGRFE